MSAPPEDPPQLKRYKGILVPPFVTEEWMEELKSFELRSDDVWVISYPKSGTTWVQHIVKLLRNGGKDDDRKIEDAIPYVEMINKDPIFKYDIDLSKLSLPRAFKSHFSYELVPCGLPNTKPCKYIYVARNPKDTSVSMFHFLQGRNIIPPVLTFSDFIQGFVSGDVGYGSWFDHVLGWWAHKDDPNVLFIKYEDMKRDLRGSVEKIARFIECGSTPEVLDSVAEQCGFQSMQKNPQANYSWEDPNHTVPFMRKGVVGDWKNHFSDKDSAQFDAIYAEKMKGSDLQFDFE